MEVDFEVFVAWANSRFPTVRVSGKEVLVDSVFVPDTKQHLSCCPSKNVFHCL
jgi:hypothetical protein